MSKYIITDGVEDSFDIEIRELKYVVRYPLVDEIEQIQDINTKLEEAQANKDTAAAKSIGKELEDFMYGLISPVGHETPIKEALGRENTKVLKNFNTTIRNELAI